MRKLMFFLFLFVSVLTHAQTEKGTVMIGGGLGLKTGEGASEFNLNPNVGFFVANNFALGGSLNFATSKTGEISTTNFGIGPFARYYVGSTNTKPFVVTEFDYLTTTIKNGEQKFNANGFGFLFGLGFAAFVNQTVAIEGVTGYNYSKFEDSDGSSGFAMRFGFQIYFNRRSMNDLKTNVLGEPK
jgi:hypothetical protein